MAATASPTNVSAPSRTPTGQTNGRKSKHRSNRKRSASSPFASLFATLASFSSSSTSSNIAPATRSSSSLARASNSLPSTSNRLRDNTVTGSRNGPTLSKDMPTSKDASSRALVRRATTPAKQPVVAARAIQKASVPAKAIRPDVFSFQNGESRPPSPRPRHTSSAAKVAAKTAPKSIDQERVYSSPIPVRPIVLPSAGTSDDEESYSDSGLTTSETPSPPDTPSPSERKRPAHFGHSPGSQKDAVGRSIHPEDFYSKSRRKAQQLQRIDVPPEAPSAPHVQMQQDRSTHTLRAPSFDYLSSPNHQLSVPQNPHPFPPGMYPSSPQALPNPYPTPPLEQPQSVQHRRAAYPPAQSQPQLSSNILPQSQGLRIGLNRTQTSTSLASKPSSNEDYFPRQYASLTQQMIHRCECIINNLEEDLIHYDQTEMSREGGAGMWHRDQLVMKLSNVIIMHHRLLDTWSKVSQIPRLANLPSTPTSVHKLATIRADIRDNLSAYKNNHGFDLDGTVAHIVNDLVQIGGELRDGAGGGLPGAGMVPADRQSLIYLFGAVLVVLLLEGGLGVRGWVLGGLVVGIWRCVQV